MRNINMEFAQILGECSPSEGDAISNFATGAFLENAVKSAYYAHHFEISYWPETDRQRQNVARTLGEAGWTDSSLECALQAATRMHARGGASSSNTHPITDEALLTDVGTQAHVLARIISKLDVGDDINDCWVWVGATTGRRKYGRMKISGRLYLPHRMMAFLAGLVETPVQPDREDCVLHHCDNPRCCSPRHLWVGTLSDNMLDCASKGRLRQQQT